MSLNEAINQLNAAHTLLAESLPASSANAEPLKRLRDAIYDSETVAVREMVRRGEAVTAHLHSYEARRVLDGTWQSGQESYATRAEIRGY